MYLNNKFKIAARFLSLSLITALISCQPDTLSDGNGLSDPNVDASFTVTPIEGSANKFELAAQTTNVLSSKWDIGEGSYFGKMVEEVFFPDAGTYTVTHTAIGRGGLTNSSSQEIVVSQSDPNAGNIVKGGKFADASDHAEWSVLNISGSGATWNFNNGSATIVAGGWNQQAIYQAIEVVAGKEYKIDMTVSGSGNNETWFEVFASTITPTQGQDYANNLVMGLNTWGGCGTGTFNGKLSSVGCVDNSYTSSRSNLVTFNASGTIYLVIKCGGNQTSGITITNVEMRGTGN